ncbi:MAG TPA: histidine kinase [Terracidiphilus sp.]|nr:histidine kinase [Terracidiphilus sp.]
MNSEIDPTIAPVTAGRRLHLAATFVKLLWIAPTVALICLALIISIGHVKLSESGAILVSTFVYSVLISLPSAAILTLVSHRYSERYPRLVILVDSFVLLGTATCGTLIGALLLQVLGVVPRGQYWLEFRSDYPISIVISLIVGLGITSFETLRYKLQAATLELRTRQVEQERAYKLLAEAQLSSLESRIHPHFLFNTLNSIAALIPGNPQLAEDTVGKLASLLRFSLNANHASLVPLSQELKIVRDYLEIEKTRFGPRIRYEITVPEALADVKVPPLALQSLVENSVKHVVSQRNQGATIQIVGSTESSRICLEVLDDGPGFSPGAITPEHGLGNLLARLELLYGSAGRLEVTRENEMTAVRLSFPA